MCHVLLIHSSVNGHLGCSHLWATNNAMNIFKHSFLGVPGFSSVGYIPKSGTAKSHDCSMFFEDPPNFYTGTGSFHIATGKA